MKKSTSLQLIYTIILNVIHIRNLRQTLNNILVLKKVHKVIKFNRSAWLKPYIDRNTDLRKRAKNDFEKVVFQLMHNAVFKRSYEKCQKS